MTIIDTRVHFAASKRRDYTESQMRVFGALTKFLSDEALCTSDVYARFIASPKQLVLSDSDFTDAGLDWVNCELHPWLCRLERRTRAQSSEELIKDLKKTLKKK